MNQDGYLIDAETVFSIGLEKIRKSEMFWGGFVEESLSLLATVKLPGVLAIYPLDKKRSVIDISSSRNPSAVRGDVGYAQGPDGRPYGSTQFFGRSNSYIEIPNTGKLDSRYSMTVIAWLNNMGRSGTVLKYRGGFEIRMKSERVLQVVIKERKGTKSFIVSTSGRDVKYKVWNYVAFTYDETRQVGKIWVNSNPVASRKIEKIQLETRKEIRVGAPKDNNQYFRGKVFCLQLYSVALSRKQIKAAREKCFLKGNFECLFLCIRVLTDNQ